MIPEKFVSKVPAGFLIDKMGNHLATGFLGESSLKKDSINKEIDSLDLSNEETRMQVFEKIGPSFYDSDEEMQSVSDQGVSGLRYIDNSLGEKLAKEKCLEHFVSFVSNTIRTNENKLKRIKGALPFFMLSKENKDKYKRLSKKVEIMNAIESGNRDVIEQYSPVKDVFRIDRDKELSVITPLDDNMEFFLADRQRIVIESVFPVMSEFRTYFVEDENVDGYIEYRFVDKEGDYKHTFSMKDMDLFEKGVIKVSTQSRIFANKKDAVAFLAEEKERLDKAYAKVL